MLLSTGIAVEQANFAKVLVPLRAESSRAEIYRHVAEGHVPIIGSDHAPHTLEEKNEPFFEAPAGFPGVELIAPLLLTEVFEGRLPEKVLECVTANPAQRFNFPTKGRIAAGCDADLAIFERIDPTPIDSSNCYTKAKFSPYEGRLVCARVTEVFIGGALLIYQGTERMGPRGTLIS
jgi:dihydroorotase